MDKKPEKIPRNCNECQYFNSCDHAYYGSTNCQYSKEIKEMVDLADRVIVVWDGSKGGTANCVKYAENVGKKIIRIEP